MKKLLNKIARKAEPEPLPNRITTETVAQHREQILAGGRRFKYPIQYAKHKLVINAIIISVAALAALVFVGWWQLYPSQNTSEFMYKVTKFIPVPVAYVDGQPVLYSDYLMRCLGSMHYAQQIEQTNFKTDSGKERIKYIKQQAMADSVADAYGTKLAAQMKISVSEKEIDDFMTVQRRYDKDLISKQTFDSVNLEYFNWTRSEYRHIIKNKLIHQKVAYAIDTDALKISKDLDAKLAADASSDLKQLADTISPNSTIKPSFGSSGLVPKINQDGGLAREASKLKKDQFSKVFKSDNGDGYYAVKLIEITDTQVSYNFIKIPLTKFDSDLAKIDKKDKIKYLISIPKK